MMPAFDLKAGGAPDKLDEQVEGEVGGADEEALPERVARKVCETIGAHGNLLVVAAADGALLTARSQCVVAAGSFAFIE
jgi:hypothetical protein